MNKRTQMYVRKSKSDFLVVHINVMTVVHNHIKVC